MRFSFFDQPSPVITAIMAGETPQEFIAEARNAEFDGAGAICAELNYLKPEFRNYDSLKGMIDAVDLPFMFVFYRNDKWGESNDEQRQEVLLTAAEAGASMIDVMGDLYDPSPMELTLNPQAIDKQKRLIDKIHGKGAQVVISSHMPCARTTEQVLEHMQEVASRGPDVVKIVTTANTEDELAEALKTTLTLKRELKLPFIHLCNGKFSRPHRFMGPVLGISIMFTVHRYREKYGYNQPTIKAMKAVLENTHWDINKVMS